MDNLINENNQDGAVSVLIVPRKSVRLHKPKSCSSCVHVATV